AALTARPARACSDPVSQCRGKLSAAAYKPPLRRRLQRSPDNPALVRGSGGNLLLRPYGHRPGEYGSDQYYAFIYSELSTQTGSHACNERPREGLISMVNSPP